MEKPNPELYDSYGHYEADLEKYNEMKSAEEKIKPLDGQQFYGLLRIDDILQPMDAVHKRIFIEQYEKQIAAAQFKAEQPENEVQKWLKNEKHKFAKTCQCDRCKEIVAEYEKAEPSQYRNPLAEMKDEIQAAGFTESDFTDESKQRCVVSDEENLEVWDCSDIAVKFYHWYLDRNADMYTAKEFENDSAAFSYWFNEIYKPS